MSIKFNADEIFEMAERIEKNGAKFYKKSAEIFKDDEVAVNLLNGLAAMEEEHRIIFAAMRSEVSEAEQETTVYDPDQQVKDYLRAMADGYVFDTSSDPAEMLTSQESLKDIYNIAIGLEKDSIIFYLGMQDFIPERLGKGKIDNIIEEEKRHIVMLTKQLAKLS